MARHCFITFIVRISAFGKDASSFHMHFLVGLGFGLQGVLQSRQRAAFGCFGICMYARMHDRGITWGNLVPNLCLDIYLGFLDRDLKHVGMCFTPGICWRWDHHHHPRQSQLYLTKKDLQAIAGWPDAQLFRFHLSSLSSSSVPAITGTGFLKSWEAARRLGILHFFLPITTGLPISTPAEGTPFPLFADPVIEPFPRLPRSERAGSTDLAHLFSGGVRQG